MKKISIIISAVTAIIFGLIIIISGGAVIDINSGSIGPVCLILALIYLSYCDITFKKSGKDMLHTNESYFTYDERVAFYKERGVLFLSGCVTQIFLVFCFEEILKILLSIALFMLSIGSSMFLAGYSIREIVNSRIKREEDDLKAQIAKEEQGKL